MNADARGGPAPASSLSAARRARELTGSVGGPVADVLVVGLGATGAGAALDAAARGLDVVAVDAHDLAFGTSRFSSKLIHGGLRYLASGRLDVAHESAVERGVLMERTAPHLVHAQPFVLPLTPLVSRGQGALARAGFRAGDALRLAARTARATLPPPRRLSALETRHLAPALRRDGLRGGLLSWDGRLTDDARLVTALARTAAPRAAAVRALELTSTGARVRDELTGEEGEIRARAVINASGVWAGGLVDGVRIRPSRGTHLVLRPESLGPLTAGLHIPIPGETNRFVLVLPQDDGRVYVGLTDEPVDGDIPDVPRPPETDIGFLLDVLCSVLHTPVHRADVVGAFAGLRPLLDTTAGDPGTAPRTADISRRHAVLTSSEGVVTVLGHPPVRGELAALPAPRRLVRHYGTEAPDVRALGARDARLREPVLPGYPVTGAELLWSLLHEGALDEEDVLDRRTRIGLVPADRATALDAVRGLVDRASSHGG